MVLIVLGPAVSGAGCIANDLWDHRIDADEPHQQPAPARGALSFGYAWTLLLLCLLTALLVALSRGWP